MPMILMLKQSLGNQIHQAKDVTPYIHAFSMHVGEFIQLYGNIAALNQQGLEKLNDVMTKQYQRSTNHHDQQAFEQILQKIDRIEQLQCKRWWVSEGQIRTEVQHL